MGGKRRMEEFGVIKPAVIDRRYILTRRALRSAITNLHDLLVEARGERKLERQ